MSNTIKTPNDATEHLYPSQGGGKEAITRIMEAYRFATRQALCNHLGISQSTMANRWMRDTFPHDWLIACHLDTGTPMLWLATGQGESGNNNSHAAKPTLKCKKISNGVFVSEDLVAYDSRFVPPSVNSPALIEIENVTYLVEEAIADVTDGFWLIDIDGLVSVKELFRLPGKKIRVENGPASFDCSPDDIIILGKVVSKTERI